MSARFPSLQPARWPGRAMRLGMWLIGIGLVFAAFSGPLYRLGALHAGPALLLLRVGFVALLAGALCASIGLLAGGAHTTSVRRRPVALAIVLAVIAIGYMLTWVRAEMAAPRIQEVSTDLLDPPPFVALRAIREAIPGSNPSDYIAQVPDRGGMIDVSAQQRQAYPDLQPLILSLPPAQAFERAEAVARELGWQIVASDAPSGRVEATASTRFFGFKDDVVVRLRGEGGGTRIDVRSKSRVGAGDGGTNAARVRKFLERMKA